MTKMDPTREERLRGEVKIKYNCEILLFFIYINRYICIYVWNGWMYLDWDEECKQQQVERQVLKRCSNSVKIFLSFQRFFY